MHWLSQPRGLDGRFTSSGGSNEPDPLNDWMNRQKWWVQLLIFIGFCAFLILLWYSGYMLAFILFGWVLVLILRLITAFLKG
jgi:hypothetical protein